MTLHLLGVCSELHRIGANKLHPYKKKNLENRKVTNVS